MGGISPEYYFIRYYSVGNGMVNHNNCICIYIELKRSNYIASDTHFKIQGLHQSNTSYLF